MSRIQIYDRIKYIPDLESIKKVLSDHLLEDDIKSILIKGARKYKLDESVDFALKQTKVQFCTQ